MPAPDPLHLVGATLARRYAIGGLVLADDVLVVYRATDLRSNRAVVLKVLAGAAPLPGERRAAIEKGLVRDRATLATLAPIIPAAQQMREVGTVRTPRGPAPYVVLDWPLGMTLWQRMQPSASAMPESLLGSLAEVVAALEPVAVALAIAHEHGVVHGGITFDRILFREGRGTDVDPARRAMLLDFGVGRAIRAIEGDANLAPADDVRALASMLVHIVAPRARALGAPAGTPRAHGAPASDAVESVFARALARETFVSVGDLWSALRRAMGLTSLRSLEATIPPERPSERAPEDGVEAAISSLRPFAQSAPPAALPPAPSPLVYVGSALALLVLGGATLTRVAWDRGSAPAAAQAGACGAGMILGGGERVKLGQTGDADEPVHEVALSAFCVDGAPVTTSAYLACAARGDCPPAPLTNEWDGIGPDDREVLDAFCAARDPKAEADRPINCITWAMADAYCAKATPGGRLPT